MTLIKTYLDCCLLVLQDKSSEWSSSFTSGAPTTPSTSTYNATADLISVIETLDLPSNNLALSLVLLDKYQQNSINTLSTTEGDNTRYYAIIASLILANKYLNDQSYTIKTWQSILCKCTKLRPSLGLLNQLESHFLSALNFRLSWVHDKALWSKFSHLDCRYVSHLRSLVDTSFQDVSPSYSGAVCGVPGVPGVPSVAGVPGLTGVPGLVTPMPTPTAPVPVLQLLPTNDTTPTGAPIAPPRTASLICQIPSAPTFAPTLVNMEAKKFAPKSSAYGLAPDRKRRKMRSFDGWAAVPGSYYGAAGLSFVPSPAPLTAISASYSAYYNFY